MSHGCKIMIVKYTLSNVRKYSKKKKLRSNKINYFDLIFKN